MLKKTVLTFAFLTILTTFYGFNAHFGTPVTDDVLNRMAEADHAPLVEEKCVISAYDSPVTVAVVPTDEELLIASDTLALVTK